MEKTYVLDFKGNKIFLGDVIKTIHTNGLGGYKSASKYKVTRIYEWLGKDRVETEEVGSNRKNGWGVLNFIKVSTKPKQEIPWL